MKTKKQINKEIANLDGRMDALKVSVSKLNTQIAELEQMRQALAQELQNAPEEEEAKGQAAQAYLSGQYSRPDTRDWP